jgi:hypothetical protein
VVPAPSLKHKKRKKQKQNHRTRKKRQNQTHQEMEAATAGVGSWLRGIGLPQLVETFEQAQYDDLEIVKELKSEDLLELGITEAGVRKKLLVHASRLGSGGGEQTPYSPKASYVQWLPQAWHSDIKIMNDGLHGHMHMPTYCVEFIDTPQFQRLRDLKQLGTSYYGTLTSWAVQARHTIEKDANAQASVSPGAPHNRFEHCLGTSHLAGQLVERFAKLQPELDITEVGLPTPTPMLARGAPGVCALVSLSHSLTLSSHQPSAPPVSSPQHQAHCCVLCRVLCVPCASCAAGDWVCVCVCVCGAGGCSTRRSCGTLRRPS